MVDRLTPGVVKGYPMPVPENDWWWMIGGALAAVISLYGAFDCKMAAIAQAKAAQNKS